MRASEKLLATTAVALRASAPVAWTDFVQAIEAHYLHLADQCVTSPIELLQVSKGRATETRELLRVFMNAPKIVEQIAQAAENKRKSDVSHP
jgi:hypothetical protein